MKNMADTVSILATGTVLTTMLFCLFIFFPRISLLEGYYFPVVGDVKINILAEDKNGTYINVIFSKYRNCEFKSLNWFKFSSKGALVRVPVVFLDDDEGPSISRPIGKQEGVRWLVGVNASTLPVTVAEAKHYCHPLWRTTTQFWPASE